MYILDPSTKDLKGKVLVEDLGLLMLDHFQITISHQLIQKMMGNNTVSTTVPSTSYAAMNEHERAAVAHEFMNNGQSGPHQAMAEAHRRMINAG